jgi:hypothetical protein
VLRLEARLLVSDRKDFGIRAGKERMFNWSKPVDKLKLIDIALIGLIPIFGIVLLFIFWTIKVEGSYGQEPNEIILWLELVMGFIILVLGTWRLVREFRKIIK